MSRLRSLSALALVALLGSAAIAPAAEAAPGDGPKVQIRDAAVTEGNAGRANATFAVSLSAASAQPVSVPYATTKGSATPGVDYVATHGTLRFAPGETSKRISVPVIGDTTAEPNETFFVTLGAPTNAEVGKKQAVGRIVNDDRPNGGNPGPGTGGPSLKIDNATVSEGNSDTVNATFAVSLSATSTRPVTVRYTTQNDSATADADYAAASGTLTFAPGEATKTVTVLVNGDTLDEANETFFVNLSNATNAGISRSRAAGRITDDDEAPLVFIGDGSATEGNSDTVDVRFTVSLSEESGQSVTVRYATGDDTATAGADYEAASGSVTFAPGEIEKEIAIGVRGDTAIEADETFSVSLSNAVNATIDGGAAIGSIFDDD